MFIRDRIGVAYYVYTFVELKLILQYAFYFSIVAANDYNTVSYTHLDVYKRQSSKKSLKIE